MVKINCVFLYRHSCYGCNIRSPVTSSVIINRTLSPGQTLTTIQCSILQRCCTQHVVHVWPPCCNIFHFVGSGLKMVKVFSFGNVRATLLRQSMHTSWFCYFKASSNMLQHIATRWPNVCNMLCKTMLRYVVLKCCMRVTSSFTTSHNMSQQYCNMLF